MEANPPILACSVGVMAHNEESNINGAVKSIVDQQLTNGQITEVIVVASGCTDRTVSLVSSLSSKDPRVRLIVQERREGKASAINLFLGAARAPVLIMSSADVVVRPGTIDALLQHFRDQTVGMVGGHPVPLNDEETFLGYAVHLVWRLHDRVARQKPKLGEVVAFRNVIQQIPFDTAVDEISIQALITQLGYRLVYEPHAIVYNRGPATIRDFLRQRRRIYAGHLQVRQQQAYAASTMSIRRIVPALLGEVSFSGHTISWTLGAVGLEALARALGYYDYSRHRPHHIWQVATTTKGNLSEGTGSGRQSILVFRIVDFHRHELELGVRISRVLIEQVTHQILQEMGPHAVVSVQQGGTIVTALDAGRDEAQRVAQRLISTLETEPIQVNSHHEDVAVKLTCGIIAFSQTGDALALSVPAVQ